MSSIVIGPRAKAREGLATTYGRAGHRLDPAGQETSASPAPIARGAIVDGLQPLPQSRFTVAPGT